MKQKSFILIVLLLNFSIFNFYFLRFNASNSSLIKNFYPDVSTTDSWNRTWDWGSHVSSMGIDSLDNIILTADGDHTFKIIKVNGSGEENWNITYDRWYHGFKDWKAADLAVDSQNNIFIVGYQEDWGSYIGVGYDFLLNKYNSSGNMEWDILWDNDVSNGTMGFTVAVDSVDYIYVGVQKFSKHSEGILLVKYDTAGNHIWNTSWGGNHNEIISEIATDSLDNIYIAGFKESYTADDKDIFLLKYNSSGVLQWNHTWGSNYSDISTELIIDSSNNIYISGYSCHGCNMGFEGREYLMKINISGYLQWNKTLGNGNYWRMAKDTLDNIYITGWNEIYLGEGEDICLTKFNHSEVIEWEIFWGGKGRETAYNLALDSNNNIYIAGSLDNRPLLIKNPNNKTVIIEPPSDEFFISFGIYFLFYTLIGIICITIVMRKKQEIDLE